ncbi:Uma2 family endonuclease [bacterium]|nr:Uma2 family endonuclease [bacterium]
MATDSKIKFTYKDYQSLPASFDKQYEILGGDLVMVPAPVPYHQRVSRNLEFLLWDFVKKNELGEIFYAPIDVLLGNETIVQPDICFITKKRLSIIKKKLIKGAPDLVVEVFSPGTARIDTGIKETLYARHKVKEYWKVDPEAETIETLKLGEAGYVRLGLYGREDLLGSPLFSNLKIALSEIFIKRLS